jgi:hypothetical protein
MKIGNSPAHCMACAELDNRRWASKGAFGELGERAVDVLEQGAIVGVERGAKAILDPTLSHVGHVPHVNLDGGGLVRARVVAREQLPFLWPRGRGAGVRAARAKAPNERALKRTLLTASS